MIGRASKGIGPVELLAELLRQWISFDQGGEQSVGEEGGLSGQASKVVPLRRDDRQG